MSKFKVGDRVRIRQWEDMESGRKKDVAGNIDLGGIVFNRLMRHLCGQTAQITRICGKAIKLGRWSGEGDHDWAYTLDMIEHAEGRKIVITTDGLTTLARLYDGSKVVKSAKAVCSPEDTFDFAVGAQLAYDRLMDGATATAPKPVEKPAQEPIKLYCVKDFGGGGWTITKGKVYEIIDGVMIYDDGVKSGSTGQTWETYKERHWDFAAHLVPLVSRPAKVGEWVYITDGDGHDNPVNSIGKVMSLGVGDTNAWVRINGRERGFIRDDEYLVLDGYRPEPEGYSGRVVCVKDNPALTVGKVYTFRDGIVIDDEGDKRPEGGNRKVESLTDFWAKELFVEFKG